MTNFDLPIPKPKAGIKSFLFTATGLNGESHRKNRTRKNNQYKRNRSLRSDLNARLRSMSAGEYHSAIAALSLGTA